MRNHIRHLVEKPGAKGPIWYWQPSAKLRGQGWRNHRLTANTLAEAIEQAEALNRELDQWRIGQDGQAGAQGKPQKRAAAGTVLALIADYKASKWHTNLARRTRADYGHYLDAIAGWAGDMPARAITPRAVQAFHDAMATRTEGTGRARRTISTPSRAAAAVRVLSALLAVGVRLGYVATNAASRPGLSVQRQREPVLWTDAMLTHMAATADAMGWHSQATAMLLNAWCGQRQADILALPPYQVEQGAIVLRQGKRGRKVALPVHLVPSLVARLEQDRQRPNTLASTTHLLLHEGTGRPWQGFTFTHVFADIRAEAAKAMPACADLRWMELRHSAVTRLHQAGVDALGISTITGHAPASVQAILDKHYLIRTTEGAERAFRARLKQEGGQ